MIPVLITFVSCGKSELNTDKISETKDEIKCSEILAKVFSKYKSEFELNKKFSFKKADLTASELGCLPEKSILSASVEQSLKLYETDGLDESSRIVVSSIETYLKYAEAVGIGGGSGITHEDNEKRLVFANVETYLKYGEAVDVKRSTQSYSIASVETDLKAWESGYNQNADFMISSVETSMKYAEAVGGFINSEEDYKLRGTIETLLKWSEGFGSDPFDFYNSAFAYNLTGYWNSSTLDGKGLVQDGKSFWGKGTLVEAFGLENLKDKSTDSATEKTSRIIDKGIVTYNFNNEAIEFIKSLNVEKSYDNIDRILDKGVIVDKEIISLIPLLNIKSMESAERIMDKGIVIDFEYNSSKSESEKIIEILIQHQGDTLDDIDRILDTGFVGSVKSADFIGAMVTSKLQESSTDLLDIGYILLIEDDNYTVISIEDYLAYIESLSI